MSNVNSEFKTRNAALYIAPIDGLRGIAVIAVLLYHLGISWIPGGFLGVDLFFVISGYVITRLILDSIDRSSALDLRAFYFNRLRRLVPALVFMVTLTAMFIGVWAPETVRRFLKDLPYVFSGSMNWSLVSRQQDYFESIGRPPLLQHTWSLGVEAQFYLIWPLVLLFILKYFGKKNIPIVSLIAAGASGIALFLYSLKLDSESQGSVSHIYFGTDTHSLGLFLGSALAVSWIPQNLSKVISKRAQDFVDGVGVVGFLGLLTTFLFINETDPTLYKLAFPLAGIFGCATLMSVVHPASRFAPILSYKPFLWIGERSYGIYLWHWVIFQVTRPSIDIAGKPWALYTLRILIVFALADISLRWIEIPVRRGNVELWFRGMKYRTPNVRLRQRLTVLLTAVSIIAAATAISVNALSVADTRAAQEAKRVQELSEISQAPTTPSAEPGLWVTGDSVILGIRSALEKYRHIELINARVGRQLPELIEVAGNDQTHAANSIVIFNVGNNNKITESTFVEMMNIVKNQPQIIVINTAVPRPWRATNNEIVRSVLLRYPNSTLIDWAVISQNHPEFFASDGVHLNPPGANAYVSAILEKLK